MKTFFLTAVLLSVSPLLAADEFPISYWCGPPEKFTTLERYQEIKDAGFTFVMPSCSGNGREMNLKVLDFCKQLGLKAIIADGRMSYAIGGSAEVKAKLDGIVADYSKHPALMGYHIVDEPGTSSFKGLGEVVAYLKKRDPDHISFINLLPNYATPAQHGSPTYRKHIETYVETVKPPFVSYDHYFFTTGGDGELFFENMKIVREVTLANNLPFWQIVLCVQHGPYRNLTEPELRYEAMQTLAHGGKGLVWFTYWSPAGLDTTFEWKHAMIDENGKREPHYDMIKGINKDVQAIGSELMKATSTAVFGPKLEKDMLKPPGDATLENGGGMLRNLTVGTFKDPAGKSLMLVANGDYKKAFDGSVRVGAERVEIFNPDKRTWSFKESKEGLTLDIPAGGAVLLRW